jgi:photosystem II stability/assembly factor-like uncharacterized protein
MELRRAQMTGPLIASILLLVCLGGCNPFAPGPPAAPTPDAQAGLSARADPLIRSGLDKMSRGDYRGAIQDLEEARVYLPANDPRLAQIQEALQRARQALTPTVAPSVTATPSGPIQPSRVAPNAQAAERLFGRVYLATPPPSAAEIPTANTNFTDQDQVALYVQRLAQATDFRLRVFRMPVGELLGEVGAQPGVAAPVEGFNSLVWYHEGPEAVGQYRAELYGGTTLTNAIDFTVRQVTPTLTPLPTQVLPTAPPPPVQVQPPAPPAPPAPPTAVFTPTATPTPRPPGPAALGTGLWRALTPVPNAGLVRSAAFSPNYAADRTLVVGAEQGVFVSRDSGNSWQTSRLPLNAPSIYSVVYQPGDPTTIFAGGYREDGRAGIYRSRNGGANFEEFALTGLPVERLQFSPQGDVFFAATRPRGGREPGSLWRSEDNGATWTQVLNLGTDAVYFTSMLFSPNFRLEAEGGRRVCPRGGSGDECTMYASAASLAGPVPTAVPGGRQSSTQPRTYGTVFRSTDGGRTWLVRDDLAGDSGSRVAGRLASVWTMTSPGAAAGAGYTLYAGTDSGMAMSTDRGESWRMAPDAGGYARGFYVVDLLAPQAARLMGVLCPRDKASEPADKGGISWLDCQSAVWTAANGVWDPVLYETPVGDSARIGTLEMTPLPPGPPAIILGMDGGRVYLYSISAFPQ